MCSDIWREQHYDHIFCYYSASVVGFTRQKCIDDYKERRPKSDIAHSTHQWRRHGCEFASKNNYHYADSGNAKRAET